MSDLEKRAARAGLRLISRLVRQGTPEALMRADQLAKTTGVLKKNIYGSQIGKQLGQGGEGIASLVADPEFGLSVRKAYNPRSAIASPKMIGRKVQLSKDLQHQNLAEVQGFRRTGTGGRMTFHEYIPKSLSKDWSPMDTEWNQLVAKNKLEQAAKAKGWELGDVRAPNFVGDTVVDPLAFRPGEFRGMEGERGNMLGLTPKGRRALGQKGRVMEVPGEPGKKYFHQYDNPKTQVSNEDMNRMFFPKKPGAAQPSFASPHKVNTGTQVAPTEAFGTTIPAGAGNKTTSKWNSMGGSPSPQTAPKPPAPPSPNTPPSGKLKPPKAPSIDWGSRA